eukprot:m.129883 g.129883  ORF g.129883 m.129883 type:complete len:377 (-) comp29440_c0_seq1:158-1288(-)
MCSPSPTNIGGNRSSSDQTDCFSKGVPVVNTVRNRWEACKIGFRKFPMVDTNMIAATVLILSITVVCILNQSAPSNSDSTNYPMSHYNIKHHSQHHLDNHDHGSHNNHNNRNNNHDNQNQNHNNNHNTNQHQNHNSNHNHDNHDHHHDGAKLMKPNNAGKSIDSESSMLSMLVDVSLSMRSMGNAVSTGCNAYLDEQRGSTFADGTQIVFSTFDDSYTTIYNAPLKDIPTITDHDVQPRGSTALYDGIANVIRVTIAKLNAMDTIPKHVGVFILTDGEENSSRHWHQKDIRSQIKLLEAAPYNWKFYFAGANQDAVQNGANLGVDPDSCLQFKSGKAAVKNTFGSMSQAYNRQQNNLNTAFSSTERAGAMMPDPEL